MKKKTKSQQMRAVLYRLWEAEGKPGTAEDYYQWKMEKFINKLKVILEEKTHGKIE